MRLLLSIFACGPAEDTGACTREPALSWEEFGRPFLETYCTGCHAAGLRSDQRNGAPSSVNLDTYEEALRWADRIDARVLGSEVPTMPPGGGPRAEELLQLREYLDCALLPAAEAP